MREKLQSLVAEMVRGGVPLDMACRAFERTFIEEVLAAHDGNHSAAARELGIHRNTLSKKLEEPPSRLRRVSLAS
ncbi:MAG: helix-turn-helix domain-containing protein [Acidobacteriota bacterium]|nr:helix-turn-helix domain-containing protein [Acidobacteriota bacterium]